MNNASNVTSSRNEGPHTHTHTHTHNRWKAVRQNKTEEDNTNRSGIFSAWPFASRKVVVRASFCNDFFSKRTSRTRRFKVSTKGGLIHLDFRRNRTPSCFGIELKYFRVTALLYCWFLVLGRCFESIYYIVNRYQAVSLLEEASLLCYLFLGLGRS